MKLDRDDEEHNYDPFYNPLNGGISVSQHFEILNFWITKVSEKCKYITASLGKDNEQKHCPEAFVLDSCLSWLAPAGTAEVIIVIWTDWWSWWSWRNKWCPYFKSRRRRRVNCLSLIEISIIKNFESSSALIANIITRFWILSADGW